MCSTACTAHIIPQKLIPFNIGTSCTQLIEYVIRAYTIAYHKVFPNLLVHIGSYTVWVNVCNNLLIWIAQNKQLLTFTSASIVDCRTITHAVALIKHSTIHTDDGEAN